MIMTHFNLKSVSVYPSLMEGCIRSLYVPHITFKQFYWQLCKVTGIAGIHVIPINLKSLHSDFPVESLQFPANICSVLTTSTHLAKPIISLSVIKAFKNLFLGDEKLFFTSESHFLVPSITNYRILYCIKLLVS